MANANQALGGHASTPEEREQILHVSNESLRHGSGIIRQLLAYSRQQELTAQAICVADYLSESRPLLHSALGNRIALNIDCQTENCYIHVDSNQLTTAFIHLLSNSAEAMPDGGKVTIATQRFSLVNNNLPPKSPRKAISFTAHSGPRHLQANTY